MLNPKIDKRDKEAIENEIKTLASIYLPQWNPTIGDAGWAVANAFSKMSEDVINHLNEVPHKLFIGYLNRLEFKLNPPLSAKAPIMFTLAKGVKSNKEVPKYAQVADKNETLFEIENSFSVTPATLTMCYSTNGKDHIYNHSQELIEKKNFSLFIGANKQKHSLFIGSESLFNLSKSYGKNLKVEFIFLNIKNVQWKYFEQIDENGEEIWQPLKKYPNNKNALYKIKINKSSLLNINGEELFWIKTELTENIDISNLKIEYTSTSGIDSLFYNDRPIDIKKPFYPFGHEPKINDTFYIASNEAFSKKDLKVTLSIVSSDCKYESTDYSEEYWNGTTWKPLNILEEEHKDKDPIQLSFNCPNDIQKILVNGELNYWIRIRLINNIYGSYVCKEEEKELVANFSPPIIDSIVITVNGTTESKDLSIRSFNNLEYQNSKNTLFILLEEENKTFYLNFNKPFGEGLISLFFEIEKHDTDNKRYLQYYYSSSGNNWEKLTVKDDTNGLTQHGICEFIAPVNQAIQKKFNQTGYWLKVEVVDVKSKTASIDIKGIYLNTAWAKQHESVEDELLGSSDGTAHQKFIASRLPAKELTLWVNEPLRAEAESEHWILWHQADHLYEASSSEKVYTLDAVPGEILFGDNIHGLIPPLGRDNIKVSYAVGGGKKGNIPKGEIKELVTTIASVDKINNVSDASGGSEQQSIEKLIESVPKRLKTRDRAITLEDYEIITKEASSDVAKVKAFQDTSNSISIVIVPFSNKRKPQSAQELIKNVENHINARKPITTKIKVVDPTYAVINIDVTLMIKQWHLLSSIKEKAHDDTVAFLHPVYGGYEQKGWEFGVLPCYSDFFSLFESIKGIDYVEDLKIMVVIGAEQHSLTAYDITGLSIDATTLTCSGIIKITMKGKDDGTNNS